MTNSLQPSSRRMQGVQSPVIPVVAELIKQHPGTLSLAQGVVNYPPPDAVFTTVEQAMRQSELQHYGAAAGQPRLLSRLQQKLRDDNGITLAEGQRVIITAGANMGFVHAVLAIADVDDEIILLAPYYFNHEMAIRMLSCRVRVVMTDKQFQPRPDAISQAINDRTRAVVTVSPNNPTGVVYSATLLQDINRLCRQHGLYHICDETYEYFTYDDQKHYSAGSAGDAGAHTISLFSLSKAYGLAGWRLGYMVVPEQLYESLLKAQDTNLICATQISQVAALAALNTGPDHCKQHLPALNQRRQLVMQTLKSIEHCCDLIVPDGAFYFFLRLNTRHSAFDITRQLIQQHSIAVLPGTTFGIADDCYIRIAYAALATGEFEQAMERLVSGLGQIIGR